MPSRKFLGDCSVAQKELNPYTGLMESLTDQVALVVGGSSGIGLGVGKALANEGMRVMLAS